MANKRRPRGDGSVYQRKDGRWVAAYAATMPDGGTKIKFLYAPTRAKAAARLREALAARSAGMASDDSGLTVGKYLDRWLASVRDTVKERTLLRHEGVVRRDLKPALGSVRLGRLDAMRIAALYQSKLGEGYAARTVRNMHATLHKALGQAVRWRLVERNVSGDVDPPRAVGNEIVPLTAEEARTLLGEAEGDPLEALYVLALTTGLRQGELLGLRWGDVDLGERVVRVRRTLWNGRTYEPKTAAARRQVGLPERAGAVLAGHLERSQAQRGSPRRAFCKCAPGASGVGGG